jgi:hypothetical protein
LDITTSFPCLSSIFDEFYRKTTIPWGAPMAIQVQSLRDFFGAIVEVEFKKFIIHLLLINRNQNFTSKPKSRRD